MGEQPLISILIRTKNRPQLLLEAIESVVAQTYRPLEIIIVNDGGYAIDNALLLYLSSHNIPHISFSFEESIGRSGAANKALKLARGEYFIFLDDDDLILPQHIQKLINALGENPDAILSHTGVLLIDEKNNELGRFEFSFDKRQILVGNFMPIHSVLFRSNALNYGCKFDEHLTIYEDWDFWIQLSRFGEFLYVPEISAYYRLNHGENSGVQTSTTATESAALQVLQKWQVLWSAYDLLFLVQETIRARDVDFFKEKNTQLNSINNDLVAERDDLVAERDGLVTERDELVTERDSLVAQRDSLVAQRDSLVAQRDSLVAQRDGLLNSRSWRVTKPLRYVVGLIPKYRFNKKQINQK